MKNQSLKQQVSNQSNQKLFKHQFSIVDLTHILNPKVPSWTGSCGFEQTIARDYDEFPDETELRAQKIKMHAGIGTHIDAPAHFIRNGKTVDELPLEELCVSCFMIDISKHVHEMYSLSIEDILAFETTHGKIEPHSFVIVHTGWERYWNHAEQYRNQYKFPSISKEAAETLLERNIAGMGIDTLSPDRPESGYIVHTLFLGAGKYIVENVANALKLPPIGAYSLALPIKNEGGTEAPIRLIGLIPKS